MKNKIAKQMIADVALKGRKAIWYGEESEVFAANSAKQCHKEYSCGDDDECEGGIVSSDWRFWWSPYAFEIGIDEMKGKPVINKDGSINPYYESLPLVCGVYGGPNDIAQVSTSYN
ncbi:hypothetical protein NVP1273O_35 [Vibrio phage 1.273.O._10N.286.54.C7]|nr:hypothetical protein NVP1273O_35 [Vibrio phage 1.273.O._10N.286.54.C7]